MGKLLITLMLFVCSAMHAKTDNDTVFVEQPHTVKFIEHPTKNAKGVETIKYYAIYRGELLATTKTTVEKIRLCTKYGAKYTLLCIGKKVNGRFQPKRIIIG